MPTPPDPFRHIARAWLDPTTAPRHLDPAGSAPADLARFFDAVAAVGPDAVLTPYLGVWDLTGRPVYALDLLGLDPFPGLDTVRPSLGMAVYRDPYADDPDGFSWDGLAHGPDYMLRSCVDVVQIVVGQEAPQVSRPARGPDPALGGTPLDGTPLEQWFFQGQHEREEQPLPWHRIRVLGSAIERLDLLEAAGLSLADLLQATALRPAEANHAARAAASPDLDRLAHLLSL